MKVISYSIFGVNNFNDRNRFEFMAYLRGLYFNTRMNKLIYPEWKTVIHVESETYYPYINYFTELSRLFNCTIMIIVKPDAPLCEAMMWRTRPIWDTECTHLLCRDADALTTYKEAQAVNEWLNSGTGIHGIADDPAHTMPMMGGMIGISTKYFRSRFPEWTSFEKMIEGRDLSRRGSDQEFLCGAIFPEIQHMMMCHYFAGMQKGDEAQVRTSVNMPVPNISPRLWESNLTCRHIGSPGVVEMETLRFFQRFDPVQYDDFETEFSNIFYWKR